MCTVLRFSYILNFLFLLHCAYGEFNKEIYYSNDTHGALDYFQQYGYVPKNQSDLDSMSLTDISHLIRNYQKNMGLPLTGILDEKTTQLMNVPRCSNSDFNEIEAEQYEKTDSYPHHHHSHNHTESFVSIKRIKIGKPESFTLYGSQWDKRLLTYRVSKYSYQQVMSQNTVDRIIYEAFLVWAQVTNLEFVPGNTRDVDIEISFAYGSHGDNFPFRDSSTLAHAFYPGSGLGGDIHINDQLAWSQQYEKNKLLYVLVHEIGHSLGLGHSSDQKSIMYSHLILDTNKEITLSYDDIRGIQSIYGSKIVRSSSTTTPSTTTSRRTTKIPTTTRSFTEKLTTRPPGTKTSLLKSHKICQDGTFDAISTFQNRQIIVFKDDELILLEVRRKVLEPVEIKSIRDGFSNRLPSKLDAVFSRNNKTYFFKGNLYWRSTGFIIDENYPKEIKNNFIGVPNSVDSVYLSGKNEATFFKGDNFYKYTFGGSLSDKIEPHSIRRHYGSNVPDLPIEGALNLNGILRDDSVYFFKNGLYWKNGEQRAKQYDNAEKYPRSVTKWWFSCSSDQVTYINKL